MCINEVSKKHKIKLTYFNRFTGQCYGSGSFKTKKIWPYEILEEINDMEKETKLPGLNYKVEGGFFIHVRSKNHPNMQSPVLVPTGFTYKL